MWSLLSSILYNITGDHIIPGSKYDQILLVKIGKYIPGSFLCVTWVLFTMVPRNGST